MTEQSGNPEQFIVYFHLSSPFVHLIIWVWSFRFDLLCFRIGLKRKVWGLGFMGKVLPRAPTFRLWQGPGLSWNLPPAELTNLSSEHKRKREIVEWSIWYKIESWRNLYKNYINLETRCAFFACSGFCVSLIPYSLLPTIHLPKQVTRYRAPVTHY